MTATKHYHVGLIISRPGLTDGQMQDITARAKTIVQAFGPEWRLAIWVACFDRTPSEKLWPDVMRKLSGMPQVHCSDLPGDHSVLQLFHEVREYDEVWCLPCKGQARLTRARVPQLYFMAQEQDLQVAARFKWIPHWVGDDKLKKGKMI